MKQTLILWRSREERNLCLYMLFQRFHISIRQKFCWKYMKIAISSRDRKRINFSFWKIFNICGGEMYSRTVRIIASYFLIFHFSSLVCHSRSFQSSVPCFGQNSNPKSVDFGRAINKKFNYVPVMRQTQNFKLNAWLDNSSVMLLHRPGSHTGCPLSLSSLF